MAKNCYDPPLYRNGTFSGIGRIVTYALEGHDPSVRTKELGGLTHGGAGDDTVMVKNYYATRLYGNSKIGRKWDDGTFSGIRRIVMTTTADTLTSLKVTYALEGHDKSIRNKEFGGLTHGGAGDDTVENILDFPREYLVKITGCVGRTGGITSLTKEFGGLTRGGAGEHTVEYILDFPREYLVKITGCVGQAGGITSLTFQTNKRKLGPCGPEDGTPFETDADGVIVGLFGTATGASLNSLGAYMLLD